MHDLLIIIEAAVWLDAVGARSSHFNSPSIPKVKPDLMPGAQMIRGGIERLM